MAMMRWALILAAAAILPSCGGDHRRAWVTIHNDGTETASFWIEGHYHGGTWSFWVDEREGSVLPHESVAHRYQRDDLYRLEVRIYRSSDFLKLFEDSWDSGDLDDANYVVTVTVNP